MTTAKLKVKEDVRFERATGTVGAWVHGVGLGRASSKIADVVIRGLHEHGVLFFDFGRIPSSSEFQAFAEMFGEVEDTYGQTVKERSRETPYIDSDRVPMKEYNINWWHTDGSPLEFPPQAALLTPV